MHLIVGVDPGTTTALAAVTLDGEVLDIHSSRDMGVDQAVRHIMSLGRASLIASDVNPAPDYVQKIASSLGCPMFTPTESLSVAEKQELACGHQIDDLHSRDALAAALNAYRKYKNKLNKIGALGYDNEVKHRVLQGTSLGNVLKRMQAENKKPEPQRSMERPTRQPIPQTPEAERIKSLEKQNRMLRDELRLKEAELAESKRQASAAKTRFRQDLFRKPEFKQQEKVIDSMEYNISLLKKKLNASSKLKDLWRQLASGKIAAVGFYPEVLSGLTLVNYRLTQDDLRKIRDVRLVFTDDPKNRSLLSKAGLNTADTGNVLRTQGLAYLPSGELQRLLSKPVKSLERIIHEYRSERQ